MTALRRGGDGAGRAVSDRAMRLLLVAGLGVFAAYDVAYLVVWARAGGVLPFGDFFALWSFARFAQAQGGAGIYDVAGLQAFQHGLEPGFAAAYPFGYPPFMLLILWPLGLLPLGVGFVLWSAATFAFYVGAVLGVGAAPGMGTVPGMGAASGGGGARGWRSLAGVALLVAPTTLLGLVSGQSGFLAGGLMVGGLRLSATRPVLAGAMLGLLAYKPQLGLLVPVALVAAGRWRCVASAGVAVLALVAASGAAFGWGAWAAWARAVPVYWAMFEANRGRLDHLMPTVGATLRWLGAGAGGVRWGQGLATLTVAAGVWVCGRRVARRAGGVGVAGGASGGWVPGGAGAAGRAAAAGEAGTGLAAVVAVGAFLATPYAYVYDLPVVTAAVVLAALRGGRVFAGWEVGVGVMALVVPLTMLAPGAWPLEAPLLAGVFWVLVGRGAVATTLPTR